MPSKNKIRKASNASITASECSKELHDLPEKDYRQLLASIAGLPNEILTAEKSDAFTDDSGQVTYGTVQEKLTPAAQSCLKKLVNEIKSAGSTPNHKIGNATFDDSFIARRIESSSPSTAKGKPVRYDQEDMKFIDEGNDVEMMDLSGNSVATCVFTRGNHEQTATEFVDDADAISLQIDDATLCGLFNDWNENSLLRSGRLLNRSQTILGPQSRGAFYPISEFIDGTDVIPNLNPAYEIPFISKPLLPTPFPQENTTNSSNNKSQPNGISNNIEDVISKTSAQDVVAPNSKSDYGKRKKNKKEKKESVMLAENVPGHMGQLPVEQLVHLIEGSHHPEQHSKKQNNKDKPLSVVADAPTTDEAVGIQTTKKERRRKSKELKEISSISNAVNIGALQTKTGGSQAAGVTATLASAVAASQTSNIEIAVASKRMTSTGPEKQCDEKIGIDQNCRCSTEDGEEEFLSADEGVASSVGDEPCVSTIPSTKKSSPTFRHTPEVTQYNVNNKVVDKNTVKVEHQCTDEQEFITVNTKKKKLNEISGMPQRNSYISKDERLQRFAEHLEPTRRSSLGIAPESRTLTSVNSPMPSNRRPTTASLADFMNEKDGGKIHKKLSPTFVVSKSARKSNKNEMSKPDPQNVGHESPERTFSYADAAKKSSEPSRDNSPACVAPTSPAKSDSSATLTSTPVLCSTMQMCGTEVLPSSAVSGVADGLSFFYDESEATFSQEADEATASSDDAFVLQLGEKTVRFVKGMASTADIPPSNSHHMYLVEMLAQRWKMFQEGQVPQIYQPRMISS